MTSRLYMIVLDVSTNYLYQYDTLLFIFLALSGWYKNDIEQGKVGMTIIPENDKSIHNLYFPKVYGEIK